MFDILDLIIKDNDFGCFTLQFNSSLEHCVNANIYIYIPDIPVSSADCTYSHPIIGTHSFTISSPLGRIQHLCISLQL